MLYPHCLRLIFYFQQMALVEFARYETLDRSWICAVQSLFQKPRCIKRAVRWKIGPPWSQLGKVF
jgi:hypothetical protein